MKILLKICYILVLIGGLNWGLVGLFDFNLVNFLFNPITIVISRIIYCLVGISAVFLIVYRLLKMNED